MCQREMAFAKDADHTNPHVLALAGRLYTLVLCDSPREAVDVLIRATMTVFKTLRLTIATQQHYFSLVKKFALLNSSDPKIVAHTNQIRWWKFPPYALKKLTKTRAKNPRQGRINRIKALDQSVILQMYKECVAMLDSPLEVQRLLAVMALTGRRFSDYALASFSPLAEIPTDNSRASTYEISIVDYVKNRDEDSIPYLFPCLYDPYMLVGEIALLREEYLTSPAAAARIHIALSNEVRAFFKKFGMKMTGRVTPHALRKLYIVFILHTFNASDWGLTEPEFVAYALHDTAEAASVYYPLRTGPGLINPAACAAPAQTVPASAASPPVGGGS